MDYSSTLAYLYEQLPMFQRVGSVAFKKDLTNTLALCAAVGNPQHQLRCLHIAGTNGKGTVTHSLSAILHTHGYKVGLYTSPHYKDFRERIKIDGQYISEQAVIDFVERIRPFSEAIQPSFFELTVVMALDYFVQQQVDVAVIEVGLGGRLDSTNVVSPEMCVITNISYDHTQMLGDTLAAIAFEKAGIIKPDIPVVIGETHNETVSVFRQIAQERHAPIVFADACLESRHFCSYQHGSRLDVYDRAGKLCLPDLQTDLAGSYQEKNIITVLASVLQLRQLGWALQDDLVRRALSQVCSSMNMVGRWQVLRDAEPMVVADSAHNEGGLRYAMQQLLDEAKDGQLHLVIGTVNDKDVRKMLSFMPRKATYYFCKADIPRGLAADELQRIGAALGLTGESYSSVQNAYHAALRAAKPNDVVYIGGSIFVVAEVLD
jgi:dihydrofolate synthase/folylpolyglutamate synthase